MPCCPKEGDVFECPKCGMELKITKDCKCEYESLVSFKCCNRTLVKQGECEVLPEASPVVENAVAVEPAQPANVRTFRGKTIPIED